MLDVNTADDVWKIINDVFEGQSDGSLTKHQYLDISKANLLQVPEIRLWVAILESIKLDWLEHKESPTARTAKHVAEIKSWIYKDSPVLEILGDVVFLITKIPYPIFKKKLYDWLAKHEPVSAAFSYEGAATLFDQMEPVHSSDNLPELLDGFTEILALRKGGES